jgi:hypothetical protein
MKKYVVRVNSNRQSEMVQDALFNVGFGWDGGGSRYHKYTDMPYLFIKYPTIGYMDDNWDGLCSEVARGYTPTGAGYIIDHADKLDGAKPPKKMVTLSDGTEISESTIRGWAKRFGEGE